MDQTNVIDTFSKLMEKQQNQITQLLEKTSTEQKLSFDRLSEMIEAKSNSYLSELQETIKEENKGYITQQHKLLTELNRSFTAEAKESQTLLINLREAVLEEGKKNGVIVKDSVRVLSQLQEQGNIILQSFEKQQSEQLQQITEGIGEHTAKQGSSLTKLKDQIQSAIDALHQVVDAEQATNKSILLTNNEIKEQLTEQMSVRIEANKTAAKEIAVAVENTHSTAKDFYETQLLETKRMGDVVSDIESKIELQHNRLIGSIEDSQQSQEEFYSTLEEHAEDLKRQYKEFNQNIVDYQLLVKRASEDIEEYRDEIEEDIRERMERLKEIINQLAETVAQLSESKHPERERALQVQQKLTRQFERLMEKG